MRSKFCLDKQSIKARLPRLTNVFNTQFVRDADYRREWALERRGVILLMNTFFIAYIILIIICDVKKLVIIDVVVET